jgi:hypothetical protein
MNKKIIQNSRNCVHIILVFITSQYYLLLIIRYSFENKKTSPILKNNSNNKPLSTKTSNNQFTNKLIMLRKRADF